MLSFFRRALGSWVVVALLAVLMIAFIVTGVGTPAGLGGSIGGADVIATVEGKTVLTADVARRAQQQLAQARQQRPDLDMPTMLQAIGGPNALVEQYLTGRMLEAYAAKHGLVASDRLVDGQIADIPGFQGPTGKFDEQQMRAILGQQRMSEAGLREGIRGDLVRRQLLVPLGAMATPPLGLATPYAATLVARRQGAVGLVPLQPEKVPAPSEADLATWYASHLRLFALPERRVLRYAPLGQESITVPAPSDAEIAARYQADAAKYTASETRTLSQIVLPDEAAARALAAKVAAGTPFAKAAADAGFGAADIALGTIAKPVLASAASPAIADAAFAAKAGTTTAPMKSVLGWHVVHVDAIKSTPARSLAAAKSEIAAALTTQRKTDALGRIAQRIEDALSDGATFAEIVKANGLKVIVTPPLTIAGVAPGDPAFKADPAVTALLKPGFQANTDDQPTLETVGPQSAALLSLASVTPAAPLPLPQVRARAIQDYTADRALGMAKTVAQGIVAKVDRGMPLAAALAEAGLPPPQAANASQIDLLRVQQQVPPALRALFTLAPGKTALAADARGWFVVHLDAIAPGDASVLPAIGAQMRTELGRTIGDEYLEQFARAARAEIKIRHNPEGLAELTRILGGQASAAR